MTRKERPGDATSVRRLFPFLALALLVSVLALTTRPYAASATWRDRDERPRDGQSIFRFYIFGDEQLWTDVLRMHEVTPTVSPASLYRTTPLRGHVHLAPCFHDGSAPDLLSVVNHYDTVFALHLTPAEKHDLVEYLKTL